MRVTFSIGLMGIKPTLTVVTIVKICDKEIYGIYIYITIIYIYIVTNHHIRQHDGFYYRMD